MTKIDNIYFLWLQEIANINNEFDISIYKKVIKKISLSKLYEISKNKIVLENIVYGLNIDKSIIKLLMDDNIKEKAKEKYKKIRDKNLNIITYENDNYPKKLKNNSIEKDIPFYIILNKNINLNTKNIYIFFSKYFTDFAKKIVIYFSNIIKNSNCNVISKLKNSNVINIYCDLDKKNENMQEVIILPNRKYYYSFLLSIIDILIIVEARYEKEIVNLVDLFLENNKEIYVVPSNIFRKNSYFSNFLIKQGADIILNKKDLQYILENIIS